MFLDVSDRIFLFTNLQNLLTIAKPYTPLYTHIHTDEADGSHTQFREH